MIRIRPAKEKDCDACHELSRIEELKTATGDYVPLWYFKSFVKENQIFLVAQDGAKILGYIMGERTTGNIGLLWMMVVEEKHRKKGIGTQLIKEFEKACKKRALAGSSCTQQDVERATCSIKNWDTTGDST